MKSWLLNVLVLAENETSVLLSGHLVHTKALTFVGTSQFTEWEPLLFSVKKLW